MVSALSVARATIRAKSPIRISGDSVPTFTARPTEPGANAKR